MSEYVVSKFVPLPDVAPLPTTCTTNSEQTNLHFLFHAICSPKTVEQFQREKFPLEAQEVLNEADESFRKGYLREAVQRYAELLRKFPGEMAIQSTALAKRSGTFAMIACELRLRPVGACALYGMDAFGVAKLALKDAQRVIESYPQHPEGYLRSAFALYLLEQYHKAMDICLEGIQWNIENTCLKQCLQLVQSQLSGAICQEVSNPQPSVWPNNVVREQITSSDFECTLCFKLFYQPVTTPCGHSFCLRCLQRALDHSNKCPVCRTVIHVGCALPVSVTLNHLVSQLFPEETQERKAEIESNNGETNEQEVSTLPLFVLFTLFPGERMSLNVFEPRYRLMIRRVMEGNRRFGMIQACSQSSLGIARIGTECEILECEPLADGRYFLEVVGRRRFDVVGNWEQDGYRVVRALYFKDQPLVPGSLEYEAMEKHLKAIEKLEHLFKARGLYHRQSGLGWDSWEKKEKDMEKMSFLACALLVNHDGSCARRRYLDCRSTLQRMEWILERMGHCS